MLRELVGKFAEIRRKLASPIQPVLQIKSRQRFQKQNDRTEPKEEWSKETEDRTLGLIVCRERGTTEVVGCWMLFPSAAAPSVAI
jgi:hypothetical protein